MELIPAQYYKPIYLFIVSILTLLFLAQYRSKSGGYAIGFREDRRIGFFICTLMVLFIGTRPISEVFVDMTQYVGLLYRDGGMPFKFNWHENNVIYNNLMHYFVSINFPPILFYVIVSLVYFGCAYWACTIFFRGNSSVAFLVFLAAFSTFSYGTNGIKAGAAASVFLLALASREKKIVSLFLVAVSLGIHHSMALPAIAYLCSMVYHNPSIYLIFWIFSLIIAAAHITTFQYFFAGLADERGASYLTATDGFLTGFRPDFILYSAIPIVLGWFAIKRMGVKSETYEILLCCYILINAVWMLCMYAEYTNRIAYLSWALYPFVLIYPALNEPSGVIDRYKAFRIIALFHLGFTLFMEIVYYGILK